MGVPLLHPWANRLARERFRVADREVVLDSPHTQLGRDPNGLPIHGLLAAADGWEVERHEAVGDGGLLVARFDFGAHPGLMAAFPFDHVLLLEARLLGATLTSITGMSPDATLVWGTGSHNGNNEGWVLEFPAGYLAAAAEPVPFSSPDDSIVGAWTFGNTTSDDSGVLVFFADGYFMHIQDASPANASEGERDGIDAAPALLR